MFDQELARLSRAFYRSIRHYYRYLTGSKKRKKRTKGNVSTKIVLPWIRDYVTYLKETALYERDALVESKDIFVQRIESSWNRFAGKVTSATGTLEERVRTCLSQLGNKIRTPTDYGLPNGFRDYRSNVRLIKIEEGSFDKKAYYELWYYPQPGEPPIWVRVKVRERFNKLYLRYYSFKIQNPKSEELCDKVAVPANRITEENHGGVVHYYFDKRVRKLPLEELTRKIITH